MVTVNFLSLNVADLQHFDRLISDSFCNPFHPSIAIIAVFYQYLQQELMNRHSEKEQLTSVSILCRITLQNAPYMDYKLLVLMSFEVTTATSIDSQEPACCDDGHLLAS